MIANCLTIPRQDEENAIFCVSCVGVTVGGGQVDAFKNSV